MKVQWKRLTAAELREYLWAIVDWESRCELGPVRARLRRRRNEAAAYFERHHGSLGPDRMLKWYRPKYNHGLAIEYGRHLPRYEVGNDV